MMDYYADSQSVSDADIEKVEQVTRGQSNNELWRQLKRDKLTASNFHDAAVRQKEPDKFLRIIMYISQINTQINTQTIKFPLWQVRISPLTNFICFKSTRRVRL